MCNVNMIAASDKPTENEISDPANPINVSAF